MVFDTALHGGRKNLGKGDAVSGPDLPQDILTGHAEASYNAHGPGSIPEHGAFKETA